MFRHVFTALDVNDGFRFDAEGSRFLLQRRLSLEGFIDRAASELQVLLDLIAGDELRGTNGIKAARSAIGRQARDVNLGAEEVFDSVAVFAPVQPSHGDLAARVG